MQRLHELPFRLVKEGKLKSGAIVRGKNEFERVSSRGFIRVTDTNTEIPMIELVGENGARVSYQKIELVGENASFASSFDLSKAAELELGLSLGYASASQFGDSISLRKRLEDRKGEIEYSFFQFRGNSDSVPKPSGAIRSRRVRLNLEELGETGVVETELDLRTCRVPANKHACGDFEITHPKNKERFRQLEVDGFRVLQIYENTILFASNGHITSVRERDYPELVEEAFRRIETLEEKCRLFLNK